MKGCGFGKVTPEQFQEWLLEAFYALPPQEQLRILERDDAYSKAIKAARLERSTLKIARKE